MLDQIDSVALVRNVGDQTFAGACHTLGLCGSRLALLHSPPLNKKPSPWSGKSVHGAMMPKC